jgi:diguanylate cyclase (GGDEF)-like protein
MPSEAARVLYIEDDADARALIAEALAARGCLVSAVPDGREGLALFCAKPFDTVVVDLQLPGMDGVTVCRTIRGLAKGASVPVIFVSGTADPTERVRALGAGGEVFCVKPVTGEELYLRIQGLLRLRDRAWGFVADSGRFRSMAHSDPLTGLGNRRAFEGDLVRSWARMERAHLPLALLMADLDLFKTFNDRFGHRTGDEVLVAVARSMQAAIGASDQAYRLGGEELAIIADEASPGEALVLGERVRGAVEHLAIAPPPGAPCGALPGVTISIGIAVVPCPRIGDRSQLIEAADRALYAAKRCGRNRVVVASEGVPARA